MANNENLKFLRDAWNSMSTDQKTIVGVLTALDTVGKALALRDLAKTEDRQLLGPKWLWTPIIGVVNTFGWVAYFLIGKKG